MEPELSELELLRNEVVALRAEHSKTFDNVAWLCKQVQAALATLPPGMMGR